MAKRKKCHETNRWKLGDNMISEMESIKIREKRIEEEQEELTSPIDELNTNEKTLINLIQNIQGGSKNSKPDLFEELMGNPDDTFVLGQKEEKNEFKEMLLEMTQNLENIKEPESEFTQEIKLEKLKLLEETNKGDEEIDDNPEINEVDKSFYTSSIMFDKDDFEGFEELEKKSKKSSFFAKFAVFLVVLMLLGTIFLIVNFVFDLNLI